jgi:ferredoxin-NADP reductase
MARTAVLGRLTWLVGRVTATRQETASARTLTLDVPGWTGHHPGQHVDIRLTAADGYSTERSYSIASTWTGTSIELGIQVLSDGEVSPYLGQVLSVGDSLELRGPVGGHFVWDPGDPRPVLLVAGGSGLVPLMAMLRTRIATGVLTPMTLLVSARSPQSLLYAAELAALSGAHPGLAVTVRYSREGPTDEVMGRWDREAFARLTASVAGQTDCFVCGPTGFVEAIIGHLVATGHDPSRIKAERFGGSQ